MTIRLVFTGEATPDVVDEVTAYMRSRGFEPATRIIDETPLVELFLLAEYRNLHKNASDDVRQLAANQTRLIHNLGGGTTLGALLERTYAEFISAHHDYHPGADWLPEAEMLTYMIQHGHRFSDVDPAEVLGVPLEELQLNVRTHNTLWRAGLRWTGLLSHTTAEELDDRANVRRQTVNYIRQNLPEGVRFRGE